MVGQTVSIKTSFIIPHKGREEMLLETIQSIADLDTPKTEFEVIIVSQNDSVSELIQSYNKTLNLSVIYNNEERTISHSRNTGAKQAQGEYLAFLDADIQLAPDWLNIMLSELNKATDTVLTFGTQKPSSNANSIEKIRSYLASATSGHFTESAPGANLFLSRKIFDQAGGFPENLKTCEDIYFTNKVSKHGLLFHEPSAKFIHLGEDKSFIEMFKKEMWRGQSNVASLKGRNIPIREIPSFIVPFVVSIGIVLAPILFSLELYIALFVNLTFVLLPLSAYVIRLKKLVKKSVPLMYCAFFYSLYFPARAIGTVIGVRGAVATSSHK
ncbi:dolichyl-phosphate mannose synthase-like protein [Alteromonas macleodii str. 'Balearic Sea AD45']|nr:dolichyl-phosphate mannose synthase-like protein [Alteromonas macleodii str. 'Balearic Sea AD45']